MIKSSSKNGIRVEKDIELVMKNTGNTPWYDYLFMYVMLAVISISIFYCLATGLFLEVDDNSVIMVLGIMVAYFMILYSFRSIFKYSGIITFFLYVMFGYINLEHLQAGYAGMYNTFISLYNEYFNASVGTAVVPNSSYQNAQEFFLLFLMVIIVAVVCYVGMFGKSMFAYVIMTAPVVYISLIVGYTPNLRPYLAYIIGTIALFVGSIVEKYGLFSKANRVTLGQFVIHTLEKARVKAQFICVLGLTILFSMIYFWYSPERYEREFNAKEIKVDVQNKIKEITSSDLLKDTFLGRLTENMDLESSSGMSNGRLGKISKIKYDHKTALRVRTERTSLNRNLYLRGFIGETYTGDRWRPLSRTDQAKIDELNMGMETGINVELLNQRLLELYMNGLYPYYSVEHFSMQVENVSADTDYDYVPYNALQQYEMFDGKIHQMAQDCPYVMFEMPENHRGLTYYEDFLKYGKFSALLQLNVLNSKLIEANIQVPVSKITDDDLESNNWLDNYGEFDLKKLDRIPLSSIDSSMSMDDDRTVGFVGAPEKKSVFEICELIKDYEIYAKEENQYFELVREAYTKLPQSGLDRVKDLVKDKKVEFSRMPEEDGYDKMNQIDMTAYVQALYEKYQEDANLDLNVIGSDQLSYDGMTDQDKIFEAVEFVKDYLGKNTKYTLSPGSTPQDKDYVENFLFDKKKGYCMHYASAATVMLRAMGVPARYVEGYVVTEEDFAKAQIVGNSTCEKYKFGESTNVENKREDLVEVNVQDTNAHAWVEVYLPAYGWTPIEVTSAYSNDGSIEVPPVNRDPKATLKPSRKPTATPAATPTNKVEPTNAANSTKAPNASSNSHTSFLQGIRNWYDGLSSVVRKTIQVITILILLLVSLIAVILIRRKVLCVLFEKGMKKREANDKILYAYREMARLTSKQMPEYTTNMPYMEYTKSFVAFYPFVKEEEAAVYFTILLKAKFGMSKINPEEERLALDFYHSFVDRLEKNFTAKNRLYYKYLFVLRK